MLIDWGQSPPSNNPFIIFPRSPIIGIIALDMINIMKAVLEEYSKFVGARYHVNICNIDLLSLIVVYEHCLLFVNRGPVLENIRGSSAIFGKCRTTHGCL